jgi:acetolactate decarboxylase
VGAQRDVLAGDTTGHADLRTLSGRPRLYALGPLEGCRGEVTIVAGVPSIATVVEGRPTVASGFDHRACFLVSSEVSAWREERLADALADGALVEAIVRRAAAAGVAAPFPFLIRGHVAPARLHVLDKRDGERHTPERHEAAKVRFTLEDRAAVILGFYSTAHRGIFTAADADVHMHLKTADDRISGHVERVRLAAGAQLGLPEEEEHPCGSARATSSRGGSSRS